MRIGLLLAVAALLAACGGHEPATPSGPVFQLNPDKWTPAAADLHPGAQP